ncbi:dihydrolipoamide acetyltransferase family protein [Amycolatopsis granulosa]|uniref:dihydrolipoamide acetyltransferase family protein n=1 Tax=Amycolatopsis granulosa TaxID=185684 RepID=UPI00141FB778|nr:dihydrolipoamide acetyltransferase family protein [Amycolatopsis granulosa]NIH88293.1 pyruvate dehydrogenase E2 component (dihydrolipoamide acetyltransferase) [Amycolatopsis granulosa]
MKEAPLVMPKMSMTMTEGTLVTWHKAEGDEVRAGEVVCEVTTDKVDMEVEATADGTLTRIVAHPEDVVAVGEPIAYLATAADDLLAGLFDAPTPQPEPAPVPAAEPAREPEPGPAERPAWVAAVPAARRAAAERGIDLATITPTGPAATIRLSDLPSPATRPRRSPRAAIARRMTASAQVPQFVVYRDLELTGAGRNWTTVFVRALAQALRRHPGLNAEWAGGEVRRHEHVGVALAVDTGRGLLAPVLSDPDLDDPDALAARVRDVAGRARAGKLTLAELSGGTTTLSNLGGLGVDAFHALLSPPQATALAVGRVQERVVPVPGGIGVALRCTAGLTVDHRVADGADAARLLDSVQEFLSL